MVAPFYRRVFESDVPFRDLLLATPDHTMTRQTGAANEYVVSGQPEDRRIIDEFADRFETDGEVI